MNLEYVLAISKEGINRMRKSNLFVSIFGCFVFCVSQASGDPPFDAYLVVECGQKYLPSALSSPTMACDYKVFEDFGDLFPFSEVRYGTYSTTYAYRPLGSPTVPLGIFHHGDPLFPIDTLPNQRTHFISCASEALYVEATGEGVLLDWHEYAYASSAAVGMATGAVAAGNCSPSGGGGGGGGGFLGYFAFNCVGIGQGPYTLTQLYGLGFHSFHTVGNPFACYTLPDDGEGDCGIGGCGGGGFGGGFGDP